MKKFLMFVIVLIFSFASTFAMNQKDVWYKCLAEKNAQDQVLFAKIKSLVSLLSREEKAQLLKLVNSKYLTIDSSEIVANSEIAKEVIKGCNSYWMVYSSKEAGESPRYVCRPLHLVLGLEEYKFNILRLVKILIKAGADVIACDNFGATPYSRAKYYSVRQDVIDYLAKAFRMNF